MVGLLGRCSVVGAFIFHLASVGNDAIMFTPSWLGSSFLCLRPDSWLELVKIGLGPFILQDDYAHSC